MNNPNTPPQTDLEQLSDGELDLIAAEMMGWVETLYPIPGRANPYVINEVDQHSGAWNPTHPDSNQCRQYLVPKLIELDLYYIMISELIGDVEEMGKYIVGGEVLNKSNRDVIIACIKIWRKINE